MHGAGVVSVGAGAIAGEVLGGGGQASALGGPGGLTLIAEQIGGIPHAVSPVGAAALAQLVTVGVRAGHAAGAAGVHVAAHVLGVAVGVAAGVPLAGVVELPGAVGLALVVALSHATVILRPHAGVDVVVGVGIGGALHLGHPVALGAVGGEAGSGSVGGLLVLVFADCLVSSPGAVRGPGTAGALGLVQGAADAHWLDWAATRGGATARAGRVLGGAGGADPGAVGHEGG